MGKVSDLIGQEFSRWLVLHKDTEVSGSGAKWICKCSCGTIRSVKSSSLRAGTSSSCGCKTKERMRGKKLPVGESSFNEVYSRYSGNAKKRGRVFEFSKEEFRDITSKPCHYCGVLPSKVSRDRFNTGSYTYNGIDRFDNSIGYTIENGVPCCEACNRAKLMMTASDYIKLCKRVAKYNE